ncbi:MAG: hypothetical protein ABI239_13365 [Aquihabitans sp.]
MTAVPSPAAPTRRPTTVTATAWVALAGLVVAFIGLGVLLRPLHTPTQDCGTAAGFLLDGRVNEFVNPDAPPAGITKAEALANNAKPCQERAGNRALPAGIAVVVGTLIGLIAVAVEAIVRWRWRAATRRAYLAGSIASPNDELADPGPA